MQNCPKCHVDISGTPEHCPLCKGDLINRQNSTAHIFPNLPMTDAKESFLNSFTTILVIILILLLMISNFFPHTIDWLPIVFATALCIWISLFLIIRNKHNIPKVILIQVIVLSMLLDFWDSFTGYHRWSITYAIPILCSIAVISIIVYARANKLSLGDYILYLVFNTIIVIFSYGSITSSNLEVVYPMAICFILSITSIAAVLLLERKYLLSEIRRRLHF